MHAWRKRVEQEGLPGLVDRSRRRASARVGCPYPRRAAPDESGDPRG
ncbi:hypothetical protein DF268_00240 [Streptomyces sp. V2]|nr:hypothetical protein DF268_00240 [Streptomyces sp. V2]